MCHQYHFCQCDASPSLFSQVQIWVDARDGRAHCWSANDSRGLQSPFWHSVQLWGAFEELKQGALLWDAGELKLKETEWWRWKLQSPSSHPPQRRTIADRYVLISRWTQIILLILKKCQKLPCPLPIFSLWFGPPALFVWVPLLKVNFLSLAENHSPLLLYNKLPLLCTTNTFVQIYIFRQSKSIGTPAPPPAPVLSRTGNF